MRAVPITIIALASCVGEPADESATEAELATLGVVINEFTAGSSGKIELYNAGSTPQNLAGWQVDDIAGAGYAPKAISGTLAPGAHLLIGYAGVNHASADEVRLVDATGVVVDSHSNFYAGTSIAGACFGRQPDGDVWASGAIACTLGAANGGCANAGATCDDGDACIVGETIQLGTCACGGGTALSCDDDDACTVESCNPATGCASTTLTCDDGNECTAESCDPVAGCASTPAVDGTSCAIGTCQAGLCTPPASTGIELIQMPRRDRVLLQGTIVLPDGAFDGEVLIEGDIITCVGVSCSVLDAAVVRTNGLILPGLIDTHNHILFDVFDETHWSPSKTYANHNQWTSEVRYKALVDTKQYLNGEGSPVSLGCEMNKYGELKALVAGTTSVQGSANPADKACYGSMTRTIDQGPNGLGFDRIQTATIFPSTTSANSVCANMGSGKTDAYVIHVAEGVDQTSRNEFARLGTISTTPGCLYSPKTTIVHGTALGDSEMTTMSANGMDLVWSPRSNVFLYGGGTDLSKTTDIPLALSKGINVSIAPDWSIGGSQNMLDELRFADSVDNSVWGDQLTAQELFQMATINPARSLGLENVLGSIAVGKKADLMVIAGDASAPYDALLQARPRDVRLVLIGGVAMYGDPAVAALGAPTPGCETIDICGASKFVCVAQAGGTSANKLGQTYSEIATALDSGLRAYDALDLSAFDFAPITPVVRCPASE